MQRPLGSNLPLLTLVLALTAAAVCHAFLTTTTTTTTTTSFRRIVSNTPPPPPANKPLLFLSTDKNTDNQKQVELLFAPNEAAAATVRVNQTFFAVEKQLTVNSFSETRSSSSSSNNKNNEVEGLLWRGVVVVLCAVWASNFAAIKLVVAEPGVDSSLYAVARFGVAAAALAPFAIRSVRRTGMDMETLKGAAVCGSWVAFGYIGQILGLLTTTASRSCVICSLHCVFVAVVAEFMRVNRSSNNNASFNLNRLAPAALAVLGVAIVELQGNAGPPTIGDALSFIQPIGFGMGYLQLEGLMKRRPDTAMPVSAIKLTVVAVAALCYFELGPLFYANAADETSTVAAASQFALHLPDFGAIVASPLALGGVLYTGLVTTALALWIESIAFARVPATDASIILTTEPLFAALFGALSLGETFGVSDYLGATLIIGACVLATLMDTPGDKECVPEEDATCTPPRKWPFWSF